MSIPVAGRFRAGFARVSRVTRGRSDLLLPRSPAWHGEGMQPDPHLHNGEEIRWQGRPDASVRTTRSDSMLVPFSLFTLGFAIFWTVTAASSTRGPRFMWVFGLLFIAFALYMVIGRFFVKAARKRRTHYFLTNKRDRH